MFFGLVIKITILFDSFISLWLFCVVTRHKSFSWVRSFLWNSIVLIQNFWLKIYLFILREFLIRFDCFNFFQFRIKSVSKFFFIVLILMRVFSCIRIHQFIVEGIIVMTFINIQIRGKQFMVSKFAELYFTLIIWIWIVLFFLIDFITDLWNIFYHFLMNQFL